MINIFRKTEKTTKEIIEEIHETFYSEVDRLLASAKISKSTHTDKQDTLDKTERLKKLGFASTKEVVEGEKEEARLKEISEENSVKSDLVEAINHFSMRYPQYKFITEESVKKICEKYNLIYGNASLYTGEVPDKNLKHIEDFKISDDDACYQRIFSLYLRMSGTHYNAPEYMDKKTVIKEEKQKENRFTSGLHEDIFSKCPLEIAAPLKDFNTENMDVKDFKLSEIEIPDPVVLQPIFFKGTKHYLIVTAWGDEASDELVVNQKMN